jgi:hypothetical protein
MLATFFAGFAIVELLTVNRNGLSEGGIGDFPVSDIPIRMGFALLMGLIFFSGCWMILKFKQKRTRNKSILVMLLLLSLLLPTFFSSKASAYTDTTIDVIGVGDEEFNNICPEGWERYLEWEIYIYDAFGKFNEVFGLDFQFRGWISFDSDGGCVSIVERLEEARQETGFVSKVTVINGYTIDIMFVFTAQFMLDYEGYADISTNTAILFWYPDFPRAQAVMHEISHLFHLYHCQNYCVMNVNFLSSVPRAWCSDHINLMNTNGYKNKFDREVKIPGDVDGNGEVDIYEIALLIRDFDATPTSPNWNNGRSDFNDDGIVDVLDLTIYIQNFGRTY